MLFFIEGNGSEVRPTSRFAMVTMAIGEEYSALWQRVARPSWLMYAERHAIDVIVILAPLDTSARAAARSPAWQKCLILSQPWSALYERIAWVDADIIINQFSPSIFDQGVPPEMVGGTLLGDGLSWAERHIFAERTNNISIPTSSIEEGFLKYQNDLYRNHGIETDLVDTVCTGVLVLSQYHRELLDKAYSFNDSGHKSCFEQQAVSFLILTQSIFFRISARFNWMLCERLWIIKNGRMIGTIEEDFRFLQNEMNISYFLHFAAVREVMEKLIME